MLSVGMPLTKYHRSSLSQLLLTSVVTFHWATMEQTGSSSSSSSYLGPIALPSSSVLLLVGVVLGSQPNQLLLQATMAKAALIDTDLRLLAPASWQPRSLLFHQLPLSVDGHQFRLRYHCLCPPPTLRQVSATHHAAVTHFLGPLPLFQCRSHFQSVVSGSPQHQLLPFLAFLGLLVIAPLVDHLVPTVAPNDSVALVGPTTLVTLVTSPLHFDP